MTNHPKPDLDGQADVHRMRLDEALLLDAGRWRSVEAHAWLILRSGHGLASEVTSLGAAQSGTVDVYPEAERTGIRLDVDLERLTAGCERCRTTRPDGSATLTLESTRVGPVTDNGWALVGTLSGHTPTTAINSELEVRSVHQPVGEATETRFIVRTQLPVAALGLCDTHRPGHAQQGDHAELLMHLLATRDITA